jgi:hypothetical protein
MADSAGNDEYLDLRNHLDHVAEWCAENDHTTLKSNKSKDIGTYFEESLRGYLNEELGLERIGNAAEGIDLPHFNVDVKTTRITRPQSSSKIRQFSERLVGVPYNILLLIYSRENLESGTEYTFENCVYIPKERTGDHRKSTAAAEAVSQYKEDEITKERLRQKLEELVSEKEDDITEIKDEELEGIIRNPPKPGVITISPAVQWRFSYGKMKGEVPEGANRVYSSESGQSTLSDIRE